MAEPDALPEPKKFGDAITADHKVLNDDDKTRDGDKLALVIQDSFTHWLQSFPCKTKDAKECARCFKRFWGPNFKPEYVYTDNSGEFIKSLEELDILHDTSTPHKSQTNAVAERAVGRTKEGTSVTLVQSGLHDVWWGEAMMCYCFLRNVVDILKGGQTAFEKRWGQKFTGPIIPFGAQIAYKPSSKKDQQRIHEFGPKWLEEIFMGYVHIINYYI